MTASDSRKSRCRDAALDALERELEALRESAEKTRRAATHEESRPENDKDTRGLEASYLARGQAQRVEETEEALTRLRFMPLKDFTSETRIDLSALVTLELDGEPRTYFLVPAGGGREFEIDGTRVQLLSPATPVGRALTQRYIGDSFELRIAGKLREYEILDVE